MFRKNRKESKVNGVMWTRCVMCRKCGVVIFFSWVCPGGIKQEFLEGMVLCVNVCVLGKQ